MNLKHGHSKDDARTAEYEAWHGMIQRCTNPNNPGYKNYGGRGIKVCQRWLDSFQHFLADMGRRPRKINPNGGRSLYSIDREENNGNYEPGNCRWATKSQQQSNLRKRMPYRVNNRKGQYPKGVKVARNGNFTARVTILQSGGKTKHIGTFLTIKEAALAVRKAEGA